MKTRSHFYPLMFSLLLMGSTASLNAQITPPSLWVSGGTAGIGNLTGNSNNVGIGVNDPAARLDVKTGMNTGGVQIQTRGDLGGITGQAIPGTPYALQVMHTYNNTGLPGSFPQSDPVATVKISRLGRVDLGSSIAGGNMNADRMLNLPGLGIGVYHSQDNAITLHYESFAALNWASPGLAGSDRNFKFAYDGTPIFELYPEGRAEVLSSSTGNADLAFNVKTGVGDVFRIFNGGSVYIGENLNGAYFSDYRLYVEKGIRAEKVRVDIAAANGWADFVFDDDYELMSTSELAKYIKKHRHLPHVPGEAQVKEEGIDLAEMDAVLLRQIEELTLRIIELQKQVDELKSAQQ